MKKIGRNDPCPCGSGKKYKRCCLGKDNEAGRRERHRHEAVQLALSWLLETYGPQAEEEIAEFFFESRAYFDHVEDLTGATHDAVVGNSLEWFLAEGRLTVGEERRTALSLALDELGPRLSDEQREWLEMMGRHAVGLYEVREVGPGSTIWLQDRFHPERPFLKLVDPVLAKNVRPTVTIGARLLPMDDHWVRTSALYPLEPDRLEDLAESLEELRRELDEHSQIEEAERPWEYGGLVIGYWLIQSFDGVVDPEGAEDFCPVVSRYRVNDWERLAAALAAEDDVEGGRTGGWTRFGVDEEAADEEGVDEEGKFWQVALNPSADDRLDVVSPAEELADEDREWLASVAGDALTFLDSEVLDLTAEAAMLDDGYLDLPPAAKTAKMQALAEASFRGWESQPLSYLAGKPPLLAVQTEEGRAEVVELLMDYEESERELAGEEKREPVSLRFLWQALGLDRDAELRDA